MSFINTIEAALLSDLLNLYSDDLTREGHTCPLEECPACSKQFLIAAIIRHQSLNEKLHPKCNHDESGPLYLK